MWNVGLLGCHLRALKAITIPWLRNDGCHTPFVLMRWKSQGEDKHVAITTPCPYNFDCTTIPQQPPLLSLLPRSIWWHPKCRVNSQAAGKVSSYCCQAPKTCGGGNWRIESRDSCEIQLESLDALTTPHQMISLFEKLAKLDPRPPDDYMNGAMRKVINIVGDFHLEGLSCILGSCGSIGYVDENTMENLAHELLLKVDFAKCDSEDICKFVLSLGLLYNSIGGVPRGSSGEIDDEELVENDEESVEMSRDSSVEKAQGHQLRIVGNGKGEASEAAEAQQMGGLEVQPRYQEDLTDLRLNNPRSISTAEIDLLSTNPDSFSEKKDLVRYDKEDDDGAIVDPCSKYRNSQLDLIRLVGAEIVSKRRLCALDYRAIYQALYGLCLMRYKRDTVVRKLTQRLRLPEYHRNMSVGELANLTTGFALIRFRHHRVLQKITTEILHPNRLKELTPSHAIELMRGMTDLDVLDSQFLTTLGLRLLSSLTHVTGPELVSALVSISTAKLEDIGLATALGRELMVADKFEQLSVEDLCDLLEVVLSINQHKDLSDELKKRIEESLSRGDVLKAVSSEYLAAVIRSLGDMKSGNESTLDAVIGEAMKPERYQTFSEDDIINLMHGIARTYHGKEASFFQDFVSEAVSSKRLAKYHIRHMSDLALSFSKVKGILGGQNSSVFWTEVLELKKARRYQPGMLADLLEAARKMRVHNAEVYSSLTYRITQRHRMDFMTLPQFVRIIQNLGALSIAESIKDKLALSVLFKEFVRPSKVKHLTTDEIPRIMQAILDLKYSERRRVDFLAMEVRHSPRHIPLWSDEQLQIVWRGFKHYVCRDKVAVRLVRKEMIYRALPLQRRPPYM